MAFVSYILKIYNSDSLSLTRFEGFFKHLYKYFFPDEPLADEGKIGSVSDQDPSAHSRGDIVPLYDEDGKFIATIDLFIIIILTTVIF
jgi:hypothetical protein